MFSGIKGEEGIYSLLNYSEGIEVIYNNDLD